MRCRRPRPYARHATKPSAARARRVKSGQCRWIAWGVLIGGVLLSVAVSLQVREQIQVQSRAVFDAEVTRDFDVIERRMDRRRELVLGLQGLMNSSESVPRESFRRYVSNIQLE